MLGVHEPDCSTPALGEPLPARPERLPPAGLNETACSLLPSRLLPPSGRSEVRTPHLPQGHGTHLKDSPVPGGSLCTPRTQGTQPPLQELLPAQRTSTVGAGACSVLLQLWASLDHPSRLLATQWPQGC